MAVVAFPNQIPPARRESWPRASLVTWYLGLAYLAASLLLPLVVSGGYNSYLAQPALWLGLGLMSRRLIEAAADAAAERRVVLLALLAGVFQVAVAFGAGVLYGFGYSTYARTPLALVANTGYAVSMLWGMEMARTMLLQRLRGRGLLGFVAVSLLFAVFAITLSRWEAFLGGDAGRAATAGGVVLPGLAESATATAFAAAAGGAWASLGYRLVLHLVETLSPALPALNWPVAALIGVTAPAIAFVALMPRPRKARAAAAERGGVPALVIAFAVTVVALIWLETGMLGVQPSLVSGVSMEPKLHLGDIVITRTIDPDSLRPGDVVRYRSGSIDIVHRIIERRATPAGESVFVTKGDNNNVADEPVTADAIEGKVVLAIPKVGLIPVELKSHLGR